MSTKKLPNNACYAFAKKHGLADAAMTIRNTEIKPWGKPYSGSVRRGRLIELLQDSGLFEKFLVESWPEGMTEEGKKNISFCLQLKDEYNQFLENSEEASETHAEGEEEKNITFAFESHLRDSLAINLEKIEKGLSLYRNGDISGVEFSIDGGRIDILAIDRNGRPVVIELKLSQGRNKVLGQILYYMSWVDRNLGLGSSRGIIIANEIYPELQLAVGRAPGVELAIYRMQFSVERVEVS